MEILKDRIRSEGKIISSTILKVDSFLNHQIDPLLLKEIGDEIARRFAGDGVTKILTVEASGIAVALMAALTLKVPVVFAKKKHPSTINSQLYSSSVYSFTKEETSEIVVSHLYLDSSDRVLIVDDFLANGEAALGLKDITEQAGAVLAGVAVAIEKSFQPGGRLLREKGVRVEALAKVAHLSASGVEFN